MDLVKTHIGKKKLIEVALPLAAINEASALEKGNPFLKGHPRNLHQWWARRPLAAARAVIFAQMVDDPSGHPERFPTEESQERERQRLFQLLEELVQWKNVANETVLQKASDEIRSSWRLTCSENANDPRAKELFDPEHIPGFWDPFAGGGALPLEAQRLHLYSQASDLNPVAVLINKALIEIPPKFGGQPPVNPKERSENALLDKDWRGTRGLANDLRYYGRWIRDEAEKRIGHLFPKIEITKLVANEQPRLEPLIGSTLDVIAWLWVRTVRSPNPAFANIEVPLASTFMLTSKAGKEAYVEPVIRDGNYYFTVKTGRPKDPELVRRGTKLSRGANFSCLMSGTPISGEYIKAEGNAGRISARLMAVVAGGERGRVYLAPTETMTESAHAAPPTWKPDGALVEDPRAFTPILYGLRKWSDLFTPRQLVALATFADLIREVRERVAQDALSAGFPNDSRGLDSGGSGCRAYAEAISVFASFALDKLADYNNTLCIWNVINENIVHLFSKQALQMAWDFPEASPLRGGIAFDAIADSIANTVESLPASVPGVAFKADCASLAARNGLVVVSTDPPYYNNIAYADLSDFFYVWLRHSLREVYPDLFATIATPKAEELVATPYRHGGKEKAEEFFLEGMTRALSRLAAVAHPAFPITIYYAFKQSESDGENTVSTGWDTFLQAVIRAGLAISGTWPIRTERESRMRNQASNALASSIVIVCRPQKLDALVATRREFLGALRIELPPAVAHLQQSNVAPVDLAQAAIGPGMAVYTRYAKVLDAEGNVLSVREALALINQTLDEALAAQEGDFDSDSRWSIAWFEQYGFEEGDYGIAETLSKAKNTSVESLAHAGILSSKGGKVRLFRPAEISINDDATTKSSVTAWEAVHQLICVLEAKGEAGAAELMARFGPMAAAARELAYRLYVVCERKKRTAEALSYNGLVQSWPEMLHLSRNGSFLQPAQVQLFEER